MSFPSLTPGRWVPGAFSFGGAGGPADLPGFLKGWLIPMDEAGALPVLGAGSRTPASGSWTPAPAAAARARSSPTAVGPQGEVLALDQSPRAMRRLEAAMDRSGLARRCGPTSRMPGPRARRGPVSSPAVLLDAPCTGLGTIRRRPEIKWRRSRRIWRARRRLQTGLLAGVAGAVARGGLLVYSTCSLEPEETEAVITAFLALHPEFHPEAPGRSGRGPIRRTPRGSSGPGRIAMGPTASSSRACAGNVMPPPGPSPRGPARCSTACSQISGTVTGLVALALLSGFVAMEIAMEGPDRDPAHRGPGFGRRLEALIEEVGLTPRVIAEEFSRRSPRATSPASGRPPARESNSGSEVRLILSRGTDQSGVPDLAGTASPRPSASWRRRVSPGQRHHHPLGRPRARDDHRPGSAGGFDRHAGGR